MRSEEARRAWGPGSHTGIVLPREERSAGHRKSFLPILVRAGFFFFSYCFCSLLYFQHRAEMLHK